MPDDLPHPVPTHRDPDDECPPISPRRPLLPLRCPDSKRKAIPRKRTESLLRASFHYARYGTQGLNAPACLPLPGRSIPAQWPCRLRRGEKALARGGLRRARGPGQGEAAAGTLGGRGRRGGLIQGTCGQAGQAGAAQSATGRVSPSARPLAPSLAGASRPLLLASRHSRVSSGRSPGTPAQPDAPASPHPFPAASPSSPSPLPPPPNPPPEWKIPPGAGGGRGHASLKSSLP